MRKSWPAVFVAAWLLLPVMAPAQTIELGPDGFRIRESQQQRRPEGCEELRMACENKGRLGEQGEGNCRRYRETCQQPPPRRQSCQEVCEDLRQACLNRDRLGEQGEGNCRRYRETCRR
jgi:hypothetical protein